MIKIEVLQDFQEGFLKDQHNNYLRPEKSLRLYCIVVIIRSTLAPVLILRVSGHLKETS